MLKTNHFLHNEAKAIKSCNPTILASYHRQILFARKFFKLNQIILRYY